MVSTVANRSSAQARQVVESWPPEDSTRAPPSKRPASKRPVMFGLPSGCARVPASARRREGLHDLAERRQRFAAGRVRRQRRPSPIIEGPRMGFAREAQGAGERNISMTDRLAEPEGRGRAGTLFFQGIEDSRDLPGAALDPALRGFPVKDALVK